MIKKILISIGFLLTFGAGFYFNSIVNKQPKTNSKPSIITINKKIIKDVKLGAFSISLNVKDLNTSKQFYETLGFKVFAGSMEKKYFIMKNENSLIGLFQGMFQGNLLTFNPGWDENGQNVENFDDIRDIQKHLKNKNVKLSSEATENTSGPASLMLADPDGNMILIDQHR